MNSNNSLVSILQGYGGGQKFFVAVFLLLPPEDLKACCLVILEWNRINRNKVWKSKAGKKALRAKLRQRWINHQLQMDRLGKAKETMTSIFCNNVHIFFG